MKLTKEKIEELKKQLTSNLEKFRKEFCSENESTPIDIFKILDRMGFDVYYANLGKYDGAILVDERTAVIEGFNSNRLMVVNAKLPYENSVFTLAHELAHYLTQKWINPNTNLQIEFREHSTKGRRNETENFMDYIAASILMPKEWFAKSLANKEIYTKNDEVSVDIIESLAKQYGVEFEAAKRRIQEVLS